MSSESNKTGNLAASLSTARDRCKPAEKDARNAYHNYTYASAEEIITVANAAMDKTGLALISVNDEMKQAPSGFVLDRTWILCHSSGEQVSLRTQGWPVIPDKGRPLDKALAAALTTSLAYRLRDLLQIPRVSPDDDIAGRDDRHHEPEAKPNGPPKEPERATAEQCSTIRALLDAVGKKEGDAVKHYGGADIVESLPKSEAGKLLSLLASKTPALKSILEDIDAKAAELGLSNPEVAEFAKAEGKIADPLTMTHSEATWVLRGLPILGSRKKEEKVAKLS